MPLEKGENMYTKYQRANGWSKLVIGAAIEVHTLKGPGLIERIYERCILRRRLSPVELKAVQTVLPIHKAQLLSYMKLLDAPIGLLINFHELSLNDGIHRLILPGRCGASA